MRWPQRSSMPCPRRTGVRSSAMHLVRNVEHYLDAAGSRPVHISEICAEFNVSRRSLHRAFYDMLGLGPVTFLPPQAPLRDPLRATGEHACDRHHRRDRHAARLHRTRPLLALLPIAVRRISFGNAPCVETPCSRTAGLSPPDDLPRAAHTSAITIETASVENSAHLPSLVGAPLDYSQRTPSTLRMAIPILPTRRSPHLRSGCPVPGTYNC